MTWEPWVAGLIPLVTIWLLWRVQILSVEGLRRVLWLLRDRHKALYHTISWLGTFLHEASHATVLLLSGHGIKQFKAGSEQGHVLPARMARGPVGFLSFLAAALAPMFIPPLLALAALWWIDPSILRFHEGSAGLDGAWTVLQAQLLALPAALVGALARLDLADWRHAAVFLLVVAGIPGARPSHVKGSRFHGTRDEGDVAVLRRMVRRNPWPLLAFLALLYAAYLLLVHSGHGAWYWVPFQAVTAIAVAGVVLALACALWWAAPALAGLTGRWLGLLCLAAFVALQVAGRFGGWPLEAVNAAALGGWLAVGLGIGLLRPRVPRLMR